MEQKSKYRQGDVLLIQLTTEVTPSSEKVKIRKIVLAHGESTGHTHTICADRAKFDAKNRLLTLPFGGELVHQEHRALKIPVGTYEVRRQRQWLSTGYVRVSD